MGNSWLTQQQKARLVKLIDQGYSRADVARILGISKGTVTKQLGPMTAEGSSDGTTQEGSTDSHS